MNPTACAFSGHRPRSFPWKYNEADQNCVLLKRVLAVQIQALAEQGVTDFLSGRYMHGPGRRPLECADCP